MIRTVLQPENQNISIQLPESFIGKQVEVIAFTVDEANTASFIDDNINSYLASEQVLSKDWLTAAEDLAWQDL